MEVIATHSFGKNICQLIFRFDKQESDYLGFKVLFDEMSIYFHMFGSIMLEGIMRNINSNFFVTKEIHLTVGSETNFYLSIVFSSREVRRDPWPSHEILLLHLIILPLSISYFSTSPSSL